MNLKSTLLVAAVSVLALQAASATAGQEAFQTLDSNGDGFVTLEEAEASANDDLIDSFGDGDENNNGKLNPEEFEKMEVTDE